MMAINRSCRWLGLLALAILVAPAAAQRMAYSDEDECNKYYLGDGGCHAINNRAECGYDGGDCCSCTCVSDIFTCGAIGFACIDPEAACVDDDDITVEVVEECNISYLGDGYCNSGNNKAICGYDGGDCCECTCTGDDDYGYKCSEFACIDPEAPCVDDDDITDEIVENCDDIQGIGNGYCDQGNNNAICAYDGGDCCSCTCVSTDNFMCGVAGFACIDPEAACVDDDDVTVEMVEECNTSYLGDGYCDSANNKAICGYDGGDCCECTCTAGDDDLGYTCSDFACIDPEAPCVDDDDITDEMAENCFDTQGIGNGYCDQGNNNALCAYDGGDCCSCTCVPAFNRSCGRNGFACIDPEAACVDDDDVTGTMVEECNTSYLGDGFCDSGNNNLTCGYDGGDCCECTCTGHDDDNYTCQDFDCKDPSATCTTDDGYNSFSYEFFTNWEDDDGSAMSYEFIH